MLKVVRKIIFILFLMVAFSSFKPMPAYQIFTGDKGKSIDFDKMMKGLRDADIVFFGENHDNSIGHWLQLQVLKELAGATGKSVVVGAEMFEADIQLVLNEYLSGLIKQEHLEKDGKVWSNYKTDYAPIVDYARDNNLQFIATNIPRRYANIVARKGLEALNELDTQGKEFIAPLPVAIDYELPGYKEVADMMSGHMGGHGSGKNMVDAQAIKDATMAYFIAKNWSYGNVFYHLNGSFHTKNHEGIIYFLKKIKPDLNVITITMADQENIESLNEENLGLADFIVAIPNDMTKSY
jgi:uncharacterized iron-regulated protein